ncbi:SDR family oxidoreductase [Acetobacter oeni]|uniref:NAD-dependent dehydratase n=1 Tax=Acetobacter oeni TaxID=304077 RepID=A0A511XN10_9PROT|nr:SDR family oxidoreductase [Acetobacter oeni]MBB3881586.1 nucleoside-diphosphate-sugar epimerase [Acetobacter oeni]NHO17599.1 NAD(P)H-binding protein [Acetobacter oeni]GBR04891.1 nucleoside-diphosphate-sugar epimerase [Acetobacter oeni LMG 21952]GEN64327.1 NAD-dependent dehydratase [Acetobacter oeni]
MRVFLTGATGFIGARITDELLATGHQVLGLTRSDAGAQSLIAKGAEPHRGTLEDTDSLRAGVARADAVIHTAFDHDFSHFVENCEKDRRVIAAMGAELKGSSRPIIITSGTGMGSASPGQIATETVVNEQAPNPRIASELAGNVLLDEGVSLSVVRLPQVHDRQRQGLLTLYIQLAREKGVVAYLDEGASRVSAAHVLDVATLYRLALDKGETGARYHAVAEEGIPMRDIAETLGTSLGLPVISLPREKAAEHFGWLGTFIDMDLSASAVLTRERLGWTPTGPGLLTDLEHLDLSAYA